MRRMNLASLAVLSFGMLLLAGAARAGEHTVTLQQGQAVYGETYTGTADSTVYSYSGAANTNYGRYAQLESNNTHRFLMKFKVFKSEGGPVPDGATVSAATLSIYKTSAYNYGPYGLYRVLKHWDELQVTWNSALTGDAWNTAGCDGAGTDRTADPVATPSCGWDPGWMAVDVTSSVQAWAGGAANEGWLLVDPYSNLRAWAARDYTADVSLRPKLTITYTGNTAPVATAYALPSKGIAPFTVTFDASASTDVDGTIVSYAWTFGDGSDPASGERVEHVYTSAGTYAATLTVTDDCGAVDSKQFSITGYAANQAYSLTLQDGLNGYAGTRDASPYKYHANNVYGFEPTLTSGEGDNYRPMVRLAVFSDEGGTIPRGAEIISATLCLYKTTAYNANWKVYQLKRGFVEGETSWNRASAAEAWDVPGASGDGTDRVAGVVSNPWMGWNPGWLMVDVTTSLQNISSGANNCGWLLVDQVTGNIRAFASRENAEQALHPKLLITYRVPPTAVIATAPNPPKGLAPCTISFDGSGSQDSDGTILFYYWSFGDGENGEGLNVQHLYSSPGCYKATLTITDDQGATATASVYVGVAEEGVGTETKVLQDGLDGYAGTEDTYLDGYAPNTARGASEALNLTGNNHPLVKFKVFTTEGGPVPAGRKVKDAKLALYKYSAYDSVVGAKRVLKSWNEAEATWNKANASTNWGAAGASQVGVDVASGEEPLVTMPWDPAWIEFPVTSDVESFRTAALANNGWQVWYYWGNSNTRQFRSSEYAAEATRRPKLTVQYSGNSAPVAYAESDIKSGSPPLGVQFTGTGVDADGTIAGYSWDFGDGSDPSTEQNPVHQYLASGRYTATLTVTDDGGLTGQATVSIEVEQPYTLTFQKGDGGSYSETEDCNLKSDYPTGQNEAGSIYLEAARSDTVTRRCLIRFVDIVGHNQGQIPHDARIVSAKLRLSLSGAAQSQKIAVHRVTEGWSIPYGAPWWATRRAGGAAWGAAGCGYVDEQHKSRVQSPEDTQALDGRPFPYEWDVTEAVKAWSADSDLNYGVVVEMTENAPMMGFRSSEHPEQALRPLLLVTISDLPDITKPKLSITSELASQTKKAFVEGTKDPEVDTISLTADGAPVTVTVTNPTHWFAFVERSSNDLVQLVATSTDSAGNQTQVTKTLTFEALDARSSGGLTLQAGDSALITVTSALPGAVSMQIVPGNGGATLSGDLGEVKEVPYPTAGEFTALAKVLDSGGAVLETYEVSVTAVSVTMKPGFALGVKQGYMGSGPEPYYEVEVTPASAASQVYLLAEREDLLTVKNRQVTSTSVKGTVVLERVSNPYLQARFGSLSGRVVGRDYISGFKMEVDDFVGDAETGEGVGTVTMTPWIGGLTVEITLGMGSKFIPEESATKTFNTSTDFNPETGQVQISVRVPETAADFDVTTKTFQTLLSVQQEVETSFTNRNNGGVSIGRALLFMREDNNEEPTTEVPDAAEQPTEAWESHGNNPDCPVAPRYLSFIERGMKGTWHVDVDFDKLFGHSVDRSWAAPKVSDPLYDSKANFKSYKPVYPGDDLGEEFRWPLNNGEEPLNNEVNDRGPKMRYKPGIQFGEQNMEATVTVPQNDGRTLVNKVKLPKRITVARLEVDGAVPANPNQPVSNSNVTASTRDLFPKAVGELPDREIEYVDIPDPENPGQTIPNAKPIAILKVVERPGELPQERQAVWSASGGLDVAFDATASYDPDEGDTVNYYKWDFEGNGQWVDGTATPPTHHYATGVYYPQLKVIDNHGTESRVSVFERIIVHNKATDPEPAPPELAADPLGTPVQVTLYTAPNAAVDVKLRVESTDSQGKAFVSVSGKRKECNKPEYFRMMANDQGYASRVVYLQGAHYSAEKDAIQLVVEGKEQVQAATSARQFVWETSQQDNEYQPFTYTDEEKFDVCKLVWTNYITGELLEDSEVAPPDYVAQKFANAAGEPGGVGGFGGPPEGSGFPNLADPFRIENLTVVPGGETPAQMTLTLSSNVADWSQDYVLTETANSSNTFVDDQDGLAIHINRASSHNAAVVDSMELVVSSTAFGAVRIMVVFETGVNTELYRSEHLQLSVSMAALPDAGRIDTIQATLSSNLTSDVDMGTLTETAAGSNEYRNTAGTFIVRLARITSFGDSAQDDFTAEVTSQLLHVDHQVVDARETANSSLAFETVALHNQGGPGIPGGALLMFRTLWIPKIMGSSIAIYMGPAALAYRRAGGALTLLPMPSGESLEFINELHGQGGNLGSSRRIVPVRPLQGALGAAPQAGVTFGVNRINVYNLNPGDQLYAVRWGPGTVPWPTTEAALWASGLLYDKVTMIKLEIEPDANQSGVTGDVVPSNRGTHGDKHYVSPKAVGSYVVVRAAVTPSTVKFSEAFKWDNSVGEPVAGHPEKWRVKRDAAGKFTVKALTKDSGDLVDKMNVWVVWAAVEGTIRDNVRFWRTQWTFDPRSQDVSGRAWDTSYVDCFVSFVATISPSGIITDSDRPDLSGANLTNPPGGAGAKAKWDFSRQIRLQYAAAPAALLQQIGASNTNFPLSDLEANDDPSANDEWDNPYVQENAGQPYGHGVGQISTYDVPGLGLRDNLGANGDTVSKEMWAREFVRIEIAGQWYRISVHYKWCLKYDYFKGNYDEGANNFDVNNDGDKADIVSMWQINPPTSFLLLEDHE